MTTVLVYSNNVFLLVLTYGLVDDHLANVTQTVFYDTEQICGANYCPGTTVDMNPNLKPPPEERIHLITGIFLGCMLAASILTAFGLDPLTRYLSSKNYRKPAKTEQFVDLGIIKHVLEAEPDYQVANY